jgi:two-component system response regulator AtoC
MSARTIIIAWDEVAARRDLQTALELEGFRVRLVRDRGDLLSSLAEGNGDISMVLLDLVAPPLEGLETLRGIRRLNSQLPVVVFSGTCSPSSVVEAMQNGATDFLAKPVTHEELLQAVRRAVRSELDETGEAAAQVPQRGRLDPFFCANPRMRAIRAALRQVAASDVPVILRGESGVGKEILAREIHAHSQRASKPFLKINCAALPLELLESELFGYERGAFTGATRSKPGKFETADGGMILLDEIGDMDVKLQAKLLHVLQDNEFQRLGGRETIRVNVRVLAATHCDLEKAIQEKRFREDLYYRLNVISMDVPPLRERQDEILPLAQYFLEKHATSAVSAPVITEDLKEALLAYAWPGNIRELENIVRKLLVFGDAGMVAQELRSRANGIGSPLRAPGEPQAGDGVGGSVLERVNAAHTQAEAQVILQALNFVHWNRKRAAAALKIDYKALLYKMKKLGIGLCRNSAPPPKATAGTQRTGKSAEPALSPAG